MQKVNSGFEKAASGFRRFIYWLGMATGFIIVAIMVITITIVFTRYVVHSPVTWAMPVTQYLLLYSAMLGGAYVLSIGGHVNVDFVIVRLSERTRKWLEVITSLMGLVFSVILTWQTGNLTWDAYVLNFRTGYPMSVPFFSFYLIMPIGGTLLGIEFLIKAVSGIIWLRRGGETVRQPSREAQP